MVGGLIGLFVHYLRSAEDRTKPLERLKEERGRTHSDQFCPPHGRAGVIRFGRDSHTGGCVFLHLFAAERPRVLVAWLLDCAVLAAGNFANAASVDWIDFLFGGDAHVLDVVVANATPLKPTKSGGIAAPLYSE